MALAKSVGDLMTSQSLVGRDFRDFEMQDAKIGVCVEKNHLQHLFQKKRQCRRAASSKNTADSCEGGTLPS